MAGVVHSTNIWLSNTMVWLYDQVRHLPADIRCAVVAGELANTETMSVPGLFCPTQGNGLRAALSRRSYRIAEHTRRHMLKRALNAEEDTILHSHFGDWAWDDFPLVQALGVPHVISFYGYEATRLPQIEPVWLERYPQLLENATLVLAEGPHFAKTLTALGCPEEKVRVQHLGVNLEEIEFRPWTPERNETLRVLMAGSFVEKKGFPDALEALARVAAEVPLSVSLVGDEIGQPRSIDEKARILKRIEQHGLGDTVRLLGFKSYAELIALGHSHDVFLSPSRVASDGDSEGGAPVTLVAMAACGIPIVSTHHCDIPEIVRHEETGLLAEEGDIAGIADHLLRLVAEPELAMTFASAGRKRMEQEFDSPGLGKRLAGIYLELFR